MMVLSEMQLASSLRELDTQDKSPPGQSSTDSGWEEVFEHSGASQDEEELQNAMRIDAKLLERKAEQHNNGLSKILPTAWFSSIGAAF